MRPANSETPAKTPMVASVQLGRLGCAGHFLLKLAAALGAVTLVAVVDRAWASRQVRDLCAEAATLDSLASIDAMARALDIDGDVVRGAVVFRKHAWVLPPWSGYCEVGVDGGRVVAVRFSPTPY